MRDAREPYVIPRRGRPSAVLVRMDDDKALQRELEITRACPGDAKIAAGKGYPLDEAITAAGVNWVNTDFLTAQPGRTWVIEWPRDHPVLCNAINAPEGCEDWMLE